jgi:2-octaprenyl-6-methoxyphenol hydroxylase
VNEFDIAVVGGGLVGASLAVALADGARRVALIEAVPPPRGEPAWDERCIALNDASRRIFGRLGVWDAMVADAAPITATHVSERGRFGVARFDAREAGIDALGYNVPLRAIGAALWRRLMDGGVTLICPARVESLETTGETVRLGLGAAGRDGTRSASVAADARSGGCLAGNPPSSISARLVVAADGARSAVRERLGIAAETREYGQHAIVSAVRTSRPHHGVAYERFTPDGPLALIPKPDDACSLVWTVPSERVDAMLAMDDATYRAHAHEIFGGRLGRFLQLGRRWAYPLARVVTCEPTAPRVLFAGNAAQSLHPVAAQGFNLGLRDVAALAELLADGGDDPGAPDLLAAYAARRARDRERVTGVTDLMVRVFSNRLPGFAQLRHWGLVAVDLVPGLRDTVMYQHLGHLGLPRAL